MNLKEKFCKIKKLKTSINNLFTYNRTDFENSTRAKKVRVRILQQFFDINYNYIEQKEDSFILQVVCNVKAYLCYKANHLILIGFGLLRSIKITKLAVENAYF